MEFCLILPSSKYIAWLAGTALNISDYHECADIRVSRIYIWNVLAIYKYTILRQKFVVLLVAALQAGLVYFYVIENYCYTYCRGRQFFTSCKCICKMAFSPKTFW